MDRSELTAMIAPVVAPLGLEVDRIDVLKAGNRRLIRVRLDGDGPSGSGPDLDQIAVATRAVSTALDGADMGSQPYVLEVSSRGVEAPLTNPAHYRRNQGRLVRITKRDGTSFSGRIMASDDDTVTVADALGKNTTTLLADVAKAVVQVEFSRPGGSDVEED